MPNGKPAGIACVQLDEQFRCKIFGQPNRPACCSGLQTSIDMCGNNRDEALAMLQQLEVLTRP